MARKSLEEPTQLPELVVYPAPWQIDYKKNFANAEIRKQIVKNIPEANVENKYLRKLYEYKTYQDELYNKYKKYIDEDSNDISIKERNKLKLLSQKADNESIKLENGNYDDIDINDVTERLYNVWNEAGRPTITNEGSLVNLVYKGRPNINMGLNKIYSVNNVGDVIAEMAHPIQNKHGENTGFFKRIGDGFETAWNEIRGKRKHYDNPSHYEYETHSIIEPELFDYIFEGIPTEFVPKKRKSIKD